VESQGNFGIQTQKKKADHRTPDGIKTMETTKKMPTGTGEVRDIHQGPTEGGQCQCRKIRRETSGTPRELRVQPQKKRETSRIPREARDPNSKEERNEWNPKGSLGSKLKRREKQVESQGKLGIQTQKKKADHRTPERIKTMETAKKMPTGTEDVRDK
jgi:hypothetical protein